MRILCGDLDELPASDLARLVERGWNGFVVEDGHVRAMTAEERNNEYGQIRMEQHVLRGERTDTSSESANPGD